MARAPAPPRARSSRVRPERLPAPRCPRPPPPRSLARPLGRGQGPRGAGRGREGERAPPSAGWARTSGRGASAAPRCRKLYPCTPCLLPPGLYPGDPCKFAIPRGNRESLRRSPHSAPLSFCQAVAFGHPQSPEQSAHSCTSPPTLWPARWRSGSRGDLHTPPGFRARRSRRMGRGRGAGGKLSPCSRRPRGSGLGTPGGSPVRPGAAERGGSRLSPVALHPLTHHQGLHFGHLFCAESSGTRVRGHFFLEGFHGGRWGSGSSDRRPAPGRG